MLLPLPCRPSKDVPAETVCCAVLAVVPIVCQGLQFPRPAGKMIHSSERQKKKSQVGGLWSLNPGRSNSHTETLRAPVFMPCPADTMRGFSTQKHKDQIQLLRGASPRASWGCLCSLCALRRTWKRTGAKQREARGLLSQARTPRWCRGKQAVLATKA